MATVNERSMGHWSLDDLGARLEGFVAPQGDFDPAGRWDHEYKLIMNRVGPGGGAGVGSIRIRREPTAGGIAFHIEQISNVGSGKQKTIVDAQCNDDATASVRSWTLDTVTLDVKDKPEEDTRLHETGRIDDKAIVRSGLADVPRQGTAPVTCNWALIDVAQRLAGEKTEPLAFEMLDELDALRSHQRLEYDQTIESPLGGKTLRLTGYLQTGDGVLPTHFWVDPQGRVLIVAQAYRAWVWQEPGAMAAAATAAKKTAAKPAAKPAKRAARGKK